MVSNTKVNYLQQIKSKPLNKIGIRFILHAPGVRSKEGVLYVRITVDGLRAPEKSTGIKVLPTDWDSSKQTIKGKSMEVYLLNQNLEKIKQRVNQLVVSYTEIGIEITPKILSEHIFSDSDATKITLEDVYERYVKEKELTSRNCSRTFQVYAKYYKNIVAFLKCNGLSKILVSDINEQVYLNLIEWAKGQYKEDYAVKIAQFFRSLYTYAFNKGLVDKNPLTSVRLERSGNYDTTHLTQEEVKKLAAFDFSKLLLPEETIRVLIEERDAFVFCCYTGLHHSDYAEKGFVITEYKGNKWIEGYRVKSKGGKKDKPYQMKLHSIAIAILEKYGDIENLPHRNNHKRNLILKQLALYVGIKKHLTTKIARKTLANYCLNVLGLSFEATAEILGHRSINFIKHYAKLNKDRLDRDIQF